MGNVDGDPVRLRRTVAGRGPVAETVLLVLVAVSLSSGLLLAVTST